MIERKYEHPSYNRSWIEINLKNIAKNIKNLKAFIHNDVEILHVIKANGYGHGTTEVAKTVIGAGASRLGVTNCLEGEELRKEGITSPIIILGVLLPEEVETAIANDLTISIHNEDNAILASLAGVRQKKKVKIHLKIDTGMSRLGIMPTDALPILHKISKFPNLEIEGIFTHLAEAKNLDYTTGQLNLFIETIKNLEKNGYTFALKHTANSEASIGNPKSWFSLIRPGIATYGINNTNTQLSLKPALAWKSSIVQIKEYPKNTFLGYNRTFKTERYSKIAILPLGYADGYRRELSNKSSVLIDGKRCRVVGAVSMDTIMVDITDIKNDSVTIGSIATLIGTDKNESITVNELTDMLHDTIPYEILCGISSRVGVRFIDNK